MNRKSCTLRNLVISLYWLLLSTKRIVDQKFTVVSLDSRKINLRMFHFILLGITFRGIIGIRVRLKLAIKRLVYFI